MNYNSIPHSVLRMNVMLIHQYSNPCVFYLLLLRFLTPAYRCLGFQSRLCDTALLYCSQCHNQMKGIIIYYNREYLFIVKLRVLSHVLVNS